MVIELGVGLLLGIQSFFDMKRKLIPTCVTIVGAVIGIGCTVYRGRTVGELMLALMPGMVIVLLGKITKEAIGYGDGMLIGMLGFFYSLEDVAYICMSAFWGAAGVALILLVMKSKKRKDAVPFVPFLFLGWLIRLLLVKEVIS